MVSVLQKKFFEEITYFGGLSFYIFLAVLFLLIGMKDYSFKLIFGLVIIYLSTFVIRIFYFKPRPNREDYRGFIGKIDASSFPSVHAARITFISSFIIFAFLPKLMYVFIILILWLLTLYSRIYLKKHYLIDVIGGVILGLFSLIVFLIS